jgi:hypothetical protein
VQIPFSSTTPTQLLLAFCGQASIKQKNQGLCNSGQEMMSAQQKIRGGFGNSRADLKDVRSDQTQKGYYRTTAVLGGSLNF